jgi:hypothetical protein
MDLISTKTNATLIIAGDFNTNINPFPFLKNISGDDYTYKRLIEGVERKSKTDWVLLNQGHNYIKDLSWKPKISDHCKIVYTIQIPEIELSQNVVKVIDKRKC